MEISFKYNIGDIVWSYNNRNKKVAECKIIGCSFGTLKRANATGNYYDAILTTELKAFEEGRSYWHRSYMEYELFNSEEEADAYAQSLAEETSGTTEG